MGTALELGLPPPPVWLACLTSQSSCWDAGQAMPFKAIFVPPQKTLQVWQAYWHLKNPCLKIHTSTLVLYTAILYIAFSESAPVLFGMKTMTVLNIYNYCRHNYVHLHLLSIIIPPFSGSCFCCQFQKIIIGFANSYVQ